MTRNGQRRGVGNHSLDIVIDLQLWMGELLSPCFDVLRAIAGLELQSGVDSGEEAAGELTRCRITGRDERVFTLKHGVDASG